MLRNRKIHIKYFIIFFCILACSNNNEYFKILSHKDKKFWHINVVGKKSTYYGICMRADKTFQMYIKQTDSTAIKSSTYYKQIWDVLNDSTILIGEGLYFKILRINEDSLTLIDLYSKDTFQYIKEVNQNIILSDDTTKYPYPKM